MKNIFTTIEYIATKIVEAISGHNAAENAHTDLRQQIGVLPDNIKKINNSDNWNAGNTKPKDYINLFKPNGARKCADLGLPTTTGYWTNIFGINNYNGDTGVTEVAFTDKQDILFRTQVGSSKMENWDSAKWKQLATTDKIDISLLNGWATNSQYYTPQVVRTGNACTLTMTVKNGTATAGTVVANIPAGFRPAKTFYGFVDNTANETIYKFNINTNGDIVIRGTWSTDWLFINATYSLG